MAEDKHGSSDRESQGIRKAFTWASSAVVWKETLKMGVLGLLMGPIGWAFLRMFVSGFDPLSNTERVVSAALGAVFGLAVGFDKGLQVQEAAQKQKAKDQTKDGTPPAP